MTRLLVEHVGYRAPGKPEAVGCLLVGDMHLLASIHCVVRAVPRSCAQVLGLMI